jgi:sugar/nucleoside kinase (ribokinase family)
MSKPSVHVLGDLMVDIACGIESLGALTAARGSDLPTHARLTPGGSAANTATWLARGGAAVTLIGAVGKDALGDLLVYEIEKSGVLVNAERVAHELTGLCIVLNERNGERTMIPSPGANAHFSIPDLGLRLDALKVTHVHVSAYMLFHETSGSTALEYMAYARKSGATVSLDPSSSALVEQHSERLLAAMSMTDILLSNTDEARELTRILTGENHSFHEVDLKLLSAAMHQREPMVVVTDGFGPVRALYQGDENYTSAVQKIEKVAATTGAGDAFNAGFLNAWLINRQIPNSLEAGSSLAAQVLAHIGATTITTQ